MEFNALLIGIKIISISINEIRLEFKRLNKINKFVLKVKEGK